MKREEDSIIFVQKAMGQEWKNRFQKTILKDFDRIHDKRIAVEFLNFCHISRMIIAGTYEVFLMNLLVDVLMEC